MSQFKVSLFFGPQYFIFVFTILFTIHFATLDASLFSLTLRKLLLFIVIFFRSLQLKIVMRRLYLRLIFLSSALLDLMYAFLHDMSLMLGVVGLI